MREQSLSLIVLKKLNLWHYDPLNIMAYNAVKTVRPSIITFLTNMTWGCLGCHYMAETQARVTFEVTFHH